MAYGYWKHKTATECPQNCPDRSATCHATCEKHLAEWKKRRAEGEEKLVKSHVNEYAAEMIEKTQRRGNDVLSRLRKGYKKQ